MNSKIRTTFYLKQNVHENFKAYCKENEFSMSDALESLCDLTVKQKDKQLGVYIVKASMLKKADRIEGKAKQLRERFYVREED